MHHLSITGARTRDTASIEANLNKLANKQTNKPMCDESANTNPNSKRRSLVGEVAFFPFLQ